ncbi:MAG: FlgD immunoglobulin-like domain containing protein [Candidatus Krumholzibacteriia bacterium]
MSGKTGTRWWVALAMASGLSAVMGVDTAAAAEAAGPAAPIAGSTARAAGPTAPAAEAADARTEARIDAWAEARQLRKGSPPAPTLAPVDPADVRVRVVELEGDPSAAEKWGGADVLVNDPSDMAHTPVMVAGGDGTLYLACTTVNSDGQYRVVIHRSMDGGASWWPWYSLLAADDDAIRVHAITVADGQAPARRKLMVALLVFDAPLVTYSQILVHHRDLDDATGGFALIENRQGDPNTTTRIEMCTDYPEFTTNWWAYLVFQSDDGDWTDLMFTYTVDGTTWSVPAVLDHSPWWFGDYDIDLDYGHGNLYLAQVRGDANWDRTVEVRVSHDLGSTWPPPSTLGDCDGTTRVSVAATPGDPFVAVAWCQNANPTSRDVGAVYSLDEGFTWFESYPPFDSVDDEFYPDLAAALDQDVIAATYWRRDAKLVENQVVATCTSVDAPHLWSPGWELVTDGAASGGGSVVAIPPGGSSRMVVAWTDERLPSLSVWADWFHTGVTAAPETPPALTGAPALSVHPNPFNPRTVLAFELPEPAPVALAVHDAAGRRVRTLLIGPLAAGRHELVWDGRDDGGRPLASGVYQGRLQAGSRTSRATLTLVR